ncbi:hypothetical protein TUM19329_15860 [Legionella antarctica]|uniref:Uncharacterized protein n=1 Tax=Legionella antarctica TaxID=2708020 RepID=A0A6F8T3H2_9GAMM|nr:hypothetical protein TUM19329_15860 [Legionella antarctica]
MDLPTLEVYRQWLSAEINKKGLRCQILLVIDSLDNLESIEQQTRKYIHNNNRVVDTVDNFQRIKFFELYINGS